jgi:hypothetical protein
VEEWRTGEAKFIAGQIRQNGTKGNEGPVTKQEKAIKIA